MQTKRLDRPRRCFVVIGLSLLAAVAVAAAGDGSKDLTAKQLGSDLFTAGRSVNVTKSVSGDLISAGGEVRVETATAGDVVAAGGAVHLNGPIGQNAYAAGGRVYVDGTITGNARLAGGEVEINTPATIRNLSAAGGSIRIRGKITGYAQASGRQVYVDGPVAGDVEVTADRVELGPNARIGGKLRYRGKNELIRDTAAQVTGGVERMPERLADATGGVLRGTGTGPFWFWTIGLMLAIAALIGVWPGFFAGVSKTFETHLGMSALLGFVMLVCVPIAALVLLITRVGIPLGLLAICAYLILLPVGYLTTSAAIGDLVLRRFEPAHASERKWRIGAAAVVVLAIALAGRLPWLGGLVAIAALLAGLGAVGLEMSGRLRTQTQ